MEWGCEHVRKAIPAAEEEEGAQFRKLMEVRNSKFWIDSKLSSTETPSHPSKFRILRFKHEEAIHSQNREVREVLFWMERVVREERWVFFFVPHEVSNSKKALKAIMLN